MPHTKTLEDEVLDAAFESLRSREDFPKSILDRMKDLRTAGHLTNAERVFEIFTQEAHDGAEDQTPEP